MERIRLYHNPRCSKSRGALELLQGRDVELEIVEYIDTPPSRDDLRAILDALPDGPDALFRRDKRFEELGLDAADYTEREAVLGLLVEHPELMQRPIALRGGVGVIGRPSEKVLELLD